MYKFVWNKGRFDIATEINRVCYHEMNKIKPKLKWSDDVFQKLQFDDAF